ncbi:alpha-tocopherol transfer protein [Gadus macrocephalus]|uniref:alpha-tocopherol transfer protein n=1 Tax=Gadus macrocephalus TaxID=80720 RepID=UPI0028CB1CF5|nr:alpha-tocopherol transfer protein [Gadus macrocephalus]
MNSGSVDLLSPDDSFLVRSSVVRLRLRAQAELDPLHILDFSDGFLIKFLRARDMDVELSLKLMLNYQRWRRESPEISGCLSPRSVSALLDNGYHGVLPLRDHSGSRVLVYRICRWNPKDWTAIQVFRVSLMTSEVIAMETETQQRGVKVIFDLEGWSFSHALQINPSLARKISSVLVDSFPLKVKAIHLINEPIFFGPVFAMLRPFLPDKIKKRVHMHGFNYHDSLTDFFPTSLLPPEYGGEGPGLEGVCQQWANRLLQSERLLEQIAAHRTGDVTAGNQITGGEEEEDEEEPQQEEQEVHHQEEVH